MKKKYDVVVIGSGVAGKSLATELAAAGKRVAIIEQRTWGGTCPNRGCDPKKILLAAVEAKNKASQLVGKGIEKSPTLNWKDLMAFKQTFTGPVSKQTLKSLHTSGAETYEGTACFIDKHTLSVNGRLLEAERFVIATGAYPSMLDIDGKEHFLTSDDFLSLPIMPETITFVGAGYIAFECAAIAAAAGAKVHVIQHNSTPLKAYDQEFVREIMSQLEADGVSFHLDTTITHIKKRSNRFVLTDDDTFELTTDLVFGTTGRAPNIHDLKLEHAHVNYDRHGISVNDHLQTSNKHIYAAGDVLSKTYPHLTPVASFEARYLLSMFLDGKDAPIEYPLIPSIVFSTPKMAQVGVHVSEAEKQSNRYDIATIDATSWFSYFRLNEPVSKVKLVLEKETNVLVGATCLNNEADVLINLFSLLIQQKMIYTDLTDVLFAYPSIASDLPSFYSSFHL